MVSEKLRNIPRADNIIVCESKEEVVGSKGSRFLQALGSTLDMSSPSDSNNSQNINVARPLINEAQPLSSTSICIPTSTSIMVPQICHKKTRAGRGIRKVTFWKKWWRLERVPYEFRPKNEAKLRASYESWKLSRFKSQVHQPLIATFHLKVGLLFMRNVAFWVFAPLSPTSLGISWDIPRLVPINFFPMGGGIYFVSHFSVSSTT